MSTSKPQTSNLILLAGLGIGIYFIWKQNKVMSRVNYLLDYIALPDQSQQLQQPQQQQPNRQNMNYESFPTEYKSQPLASSEGDDADVFRYAATSNDSINTKVSSSKSSSLRNKQKTKVAFQDVVGQASNKAPITELDEFNSEVYRVDDADDDGF